MYRHAQHMCGKLVEFCLLIPLWDPDTELEPSDLGGKCHPLATLQPWELFLKFIVGWDFLSLCVHVYLCVFTLGCMFSLITFIKLSRLGWLFTEPRDLYIPPLSQCWDQKHAPPHRASFLWFWRWNPGPHACKAPSSIELSIPTRW